VAVDVGDHTPDAVEVGHVGGDGEASGQGRGKIFQRVRAAGDECDLSAACGEGAGGGETDP
jgi:hypothetical protein